MTDPRVFPQTPKPAAGEIRQLLVNPEVWRSLEAWLHSMRIVLLPVAAQDGDLPTYCMTPVDGPWGGDPDGE